MNPQVSQNKTASKEDESLTVIDNRTGKSYNIPIDHGTINSRIFFKMTGEGVKGLRTYDPGYMNTASCTSRITFIDGEYTGSPYYTADFSFLDETRFICTLLRWSRSPAFRYFYHFA